MGKENFIKEALHNPTDYVSYHVGRELAELYPGRVILEGETSYFDLEAFVRAEKCSIVNESSLFHQVKTVWDGPDQDLIRTIENSWLNVLWRGNLLDVVLVTYSQRCYPSRHHWIVANDQQLAEEFLAEVCAWTSEVRGEVLIFQDGAWKKSEDLYKAIKSATFDNLVLRDELKKEIQEDFSRFFDSRAIYERYRIPWKRGVLFIGPPGNGKTHTVKALVNQLAQPCLYVKSFKTDYTTDQESMREVFARARMTTPCLLVMEDLDSMLDNQNRSFFLNELDGFETNTGVVILATTNHPDRLDPALLDRPSRFDRKYYFELPSEPERLTYIDSWNEQLQPELQFSQTAGQNVVRETEGFSFAYLKELFLSSMMQWLASEGRVSMDAVIVENAIQLREQMKQQTKQNEVSPEDEHSTDD